MLPEMDSVSSAGSSPPAGGGMIRRHRVSSSIEVARRKQGTTMATPRPRSLISGDCGRTKTTSSGESHAAARSNDFAGASFSLAPSAVGVLLERRISMRDTAVRRGKRASADLIFPAGMPRKVRPGRRAQRPRHRRESRPVRVAARAQRRRTRIWRSMSSGRSLIRSSPSGSPAPCGGGSIVVVPSTRKTRWRTLCGQKNTTSSLVT
jgi:hypothetical protein